MEYMKIHNVIQKSPEWHALRALNFTASELGQWALEPVRNCMTVDAIKTELDTLGINRKGIAKRDDLVALLPDLPEYRTLTDGARTAILSKIKQHRLAYFRQCDRESLSPEDRIWIEREEELAAQSEAAFARNIPVKYGNLLEPFARSAYESLTGFEVEEVGFVESDSGGFGCSPDGLVYDLFGLSHGVEIKCPIPETHLAWLIDGGIPEQHALQVHCSMAVMDLQRYDFFSYCPGEKSLHVIVDRDATTDQLLVGLQTLVAEKAKMLEEIKSIRTA